MERWGKQLTREGAFTSNISAMRTESMSIPTPLSLPATHQELQEISLTVYKSNTPINISIFEKELSNHPNRPLVEWAIAALKYGVRTGYTGDRTGYQFPNLKSADEKPELLRENIQKELSVGRLIGPLKLAPVNAKLSPLGIVPKPRTDKFRTINHLSYPYGESVNDGQYDEDLWTEYDLIGVTLDWIRHHGRGCYMTGGDVENAFRIIPVHPKDILLQFFEFEGNIYGDMNLVFGMRSSPIIFNTFAGLMGWICIRNHEIACFNNYMDDYISINKDQTSAEHTFQLFQKVFAENGWPLKDSKLVPPTQKMVHLGHEINTLDMTITLPADRKQDLLEELERWIKSDRKMLKSFRSLAGWLIWCCVTCPHIRPFIQPLFYKMGRDISPDTYLYVSANIRLALQTIHDILSLWDGTKLLAPLEWGPEFTTSHLYVDATPKRISAWYPELNEYSFYTFHEERPILEAEACALLTGLTYLSSRKQINNNRLVMFSDNMAVTEAVHKGSAPNPILNSYICSIVKTCYDAKIQTKIQYIPSEKNVEADCISRGDLDRFHQLHPLAVNVYAHVVTPFHWNASANHGRSISSSSSASRKNKRSSRKQASKSHFKGLHKTRR